MKMFEREDWKNYLSDESKQVLEELFNSTRKHRGAYSQSDNIKIAQIWSALIEIKKELEEVKEHLGKVEKPWEAIISIGEAEKERVIEKFVADITKPTDEDTQDATKKLVDSLMKF